MRKPDGAGGLTMRIAGLAGLLLAISSTASLAEFEPGSLVPSKPGAVIDGWTVDNTGMDNNNEFYVVLKKGTAYRLAWIDPLGNVAQGTVDQVALLAVQPTVRLKGEVGVAGPDCSKGSEQPIFAFYKAATGSARGYFIENEKIVMKRWKTKRAFCQNTGS
ncbi:hypothetical protein [Sphingomonas jaspsi]|uniref:hypothetical protein n=1 Tax=Sphingomonas jaspsi TaxID=392409 RepID=UPI0012EB585F|nr:hypothetical protein [Sphingomonas jaspsi]